MSGNGFAEALPRSAPRGWQWTTAVASCVTVVAAMAIAPAVHTAGTRMLHSSGKLERVIVRAVPGHVGEAETLVRNAGGSVGRELGIISGFAAEEAQVVTRDQPGHERAVAVGVEVAQRRALGVEREVGAVHDLARGVEPRDRRDAAVDQRDVDALAGVARVPPRLRAGAERGVRHRVEIRVG